MRGVMAIWIRFRSFIPAVICICSLNFQAEPIAVHHQEGTIHAFLEMRSEDGHVLAAGDLVQVVRGDQITARTTFRFTDGSVDDETTIFSQRHNLSLVSDHHVQKGPFFPHPLDTLIDSGKGQVTVRSTDKDGKDQVKTDHLTLPPDLANGMVPLVIENMQADAPQATVSMLVFTPSPRVVKLAISRQGEEPFSVVGTSHQGIHYEIRIELNGVAGVVAPLIGKQPPNIQLWIVGGQAPTFVREQGPIYADGPVLIVELARPTWLDSSKEGE